MSSKTNEGGSAFPQAVRVWDNDAMSWAVHSQGGMTLRDWFAGQALPQLAHDWCECDPKHYEAVALNCYKLADAMLAARKATP